LAFALSELRVTQHRVVLSEWTKFRSLRSTLWSLFAAIALAIGFSCLAAVVTVIRWSHMSLEEQLARNPITIAPAAGAGRG
jgi:ABC-2 type transport system permease protein